MPILLLFAAAGAVYDPSAMDWCRPTNQPVRAVYGLRTVPPQLAPPRRDVSWLPAYPNQLNPPSRHATIPTTFGPVFLVQRTPDTWPVYPDRALGPAGPHASQQKAFFRPETPMPDAPRLSWHPTYPDQDLRASSHALRPSFFWGVLTPAAAPPYDPALMDWDRRGQKEPHRRVIGLTGYPLEGALKPTAPYDPSKLEWFQRPELTPFKRRFRLLTSLPLGEPQSLLPWIAPIYPDRVLGKLSLLTAQQQAYFAPITTPVAFLVAYTAAYDSVYPSQLWPKPSILTAQQRAFFRPETPMPNAPALSWHPLYPDRIDPKKALGTHLIPFYRSEELPLPGAPNTSTLAIYPDKVWPKPGLLAAQQRAFFRPETPLPNAPALSWHPLYPDFAKGPAGLHVSNQLAFTKPWIPIIQQPRSITLMGNYYPLITLVGNYQILITPTGEYVPVIVLTGVIA